MIPKIRNFQHPLLKVFCELAKRVVELVVEESAGKAAFMYVEKDVREKEDEEEEKGEEEKGERDKEEGYK